MSRILPVADITVADFLMAWPQAAQVFIRHGMACVGCELSAFDTLAEVADTYELDLEHFLETLAATINVDSDPATA